MHTVQFMQCEYGNNVVIQCSTTKQLHSIWSVQVVNDLSVDVDLLMTTGTSVLKTVRVVKSGETFPFPIAAVQQERKFSVIPSGFG